MGPTETFVATRPKAESLAFMMEQLQAQPDKLPKGFHSVNVEPGVAMLVEPVNDPAYVFVPPATVHTFASAPGSGTDALRRRMHAGIFFTSIVERAKRETAVGTLDVARAVPRGHRL